MARLLKLPPHHLIHHPRIALDDLDHLGGDIFFHVVGDGDAVVVVLIHLHRGFHGLEELLFFYTGQDEASLVQGFWAFGAGADADRREGMALTREETGFFREGPGVGYHGKGVHLEVVVVMKAHGLVLDDSGIQFKAGGFNALFTPGMAGVENGQVVGFGHSVDGIKERQEVLLSINVLFPMGREENILLGF